MTRPLVGVTGPDRGGTVAWELTRIALRRAGARAVRITPDAPQSIDRLDALIVGGGADIDPGLYYDEPGHDEPADDAGEGFAAVVEASGRTVRQHRTPALSLLLAPGIFLMRKVFEAHTTGPDPRRDALERTLLEGALSRRRPILGICRGAQLLNVVLGGTLHQDVSSFYVETPQLRTVLPRKRVEIVEGSTLARVIGAAPCAVNALHHQAVDQLGRDVAIVARERNGIVQGIEVRGHPYAIGVQWHPEYIPQQRRQQALFWALVDAVRGVEQPRATHASAAHPPFS
jgi:putative glutamine amidotransferase